MQRNSCLVIRLPNCRLHRIIQQFANIFPSSIRIRMSSLLIMHEYSLEPIFLRRVLRDAGFDSVCMATSVSSAGDMYDQGKWFPVFKRILSFLSLVMSWMTGGKLLFTPSILVIAYKQDV